MFTRPVLDAFRRGDEASLLSQLGLGALEGAALAGAKTLAQLALETRRESISVIGNYEVFVRRTPAGDLRQIVAPVRLGLGDKTLYQIPIRRPHDPDSDEIIPDLKAWAKTHQGKVAIWKDTVQKNAELTYQGYLRLNQAAGCAVGQPPHVMVDGVERTNPYVERAPAPGGRPGDIVRVVLNVVVVGPAPFTGNPVVVNYTLDYDPAKDLQHMLAYVAKEHPDDCFLIDESDLEKKPGWKFIPLYGGVGYHVNLRLDAIREVYADFTNILQNAVKKAQTIARRNAMKSHPALACHTVEVGTDGKAVVGVVGWAGDEAAMARWTRLVDRLSRGQPIDNEVETIEGQEVYDAERHTGAAGHDEGERTRAAAPVEPPQGLDPELAAKNDLIQAIDDVIVLLPAGKAASLGYKPQSQNLEELRAVLTAAQAMTEGGK